MRKILGTLAIAVLALTGCSAGDSTPETVQAETVASEAATITAAPIEAKAAAPETAAASGAYGDPTTDAAFLEGVKGAWTGTHPSDSDLVSAAKFACQEFEAGKSYQEMRPVSGTSSDDLNNGVAVAVYASRNYCTDFNTDNG